MPKVSVIIPCYNQGKYIDEAVNSVLNQSFQDFEIIIVNDGSTDEFTNDILKKYNKPKTKVFTTENKGVSAARNTAIKKSQGEFILPLDADDKIEKSFLGKAVKIIDNNDNIKIVYCDIKLFGDEKGIQTLPRFNSELFFTQNIIPVSGLFRLSDYKNTDGYDENIKDGLEDWEFWISMLKKGGNVYKINEPLLFYRQYKTSRQHLLDKDLENKKRIRCYIENKHFQFYKQKYGSILSLATENQKLLQKIRLIENSKAFKLGRIILYPIKYIFNK